MPEKEEMQDLLNRCKAAQVNNAQMKELEKVINLPKPDLTKKQMMAAMASMYLFKTIIR